MKTNFYIESCGNSYLEQDVVKAVKQQWKDEGKKISEIETLSIYLKPEECKAYYIAVVDAEEVSGFVQL